MFFLFTVAPGDRSVPELAELAGKVVTSVGLCVAGICTVVRIVVIEVFGVAEEYRQRREAARVNGAKHEENHD